MRVILAIAGWIESSEHRQPNSLEKWISSKTVGSPFKFPSSSVNISRENV
jgi:hypothetical protein